MREWFDTIIPGLSLSKPTHVLDGDLPKRDWFDRPRTPLRSSVDGRSEIHTVLPGHPIGLHPHHVAELAGNGNHLHFYGKITHGQWLQWIEKTQPMAPEYLHLHTNGRPKPQRRLFMFDHHVPELVDFFRGVIGSASSKSTRATKKRPFIFG